MFKSVNTPQPARALPAEHRLFTQTERFTIDGAVNYWMFESPATGPRAENDRSAIIRWERFSNLHSEPSVELLRKGLVSFKIAEALLRCNKGRSRVKE